jgi:hypothetical protein
MIVKMHRLAVVALACVACGSKEAPAVTPNASGSVTPSYASMLPAVPPKKACVPTGFFGTERYHMSIYDSDAGGLAVTRQKRSTTPETREATYASGVLSVGAGHRGSPNDVPFTCEVSRDCMMLKCQFPVTSGWPDTLTQDPEDRPLPDL